MRLLRDPRTTFVVLLLIGTALLLAQSGTSLLYRYDDAYFAAAARQIADSGNWLDLQIQGEPILEKPPLVFWLQAASIRAFGANSFAVRLPGALLVLVTGLATWSCVRRWRSDREALIAALVIFTTQQLVLYARRPVTEVYVVAWSWLAALSYLELLREDHTRSRILLGTLLGLAFMTKGIMGLLALGPILIHATLQRGLGRLILHRGSLAGLGAFLAITAPWHVWMLVQHGRSFAHHYFWQTQLSFLSGTTHSDPWSADVIVRKIAETYWPWLLALVFSLIASARQLRHDQEGWLRFLWIWCGTILLVFHLVYVKRDRYVLSIYPAFAVLIGWWMARVRGGQWWTRLTLAFAVAMAGFALLSPRWTLIADYDHYGEKTGALLSIIDSDARTPVLVHQKDGYCFNCDTIAFYRGVQAESFDPLRLADWARSGPVRIYGTRKTFEQIAIDLPDGLSARPLYADEKAGVFEVRAHAQATGARLTWPQPPTDAWPGRRAGLARRAKD